MKAGILSDTHGCNSEIIRKVVENLKGRGVELLFHCGDLEPQHLDVELFGGLPVVCALTKEQEFSSDFTFPPNGWCFTRPGSIANRIVNLGKTKVYIGHERSFDALVNPVKVTEFIQQIRQICDGTDLVFSGHTHFQFLIQKGDVFWINPGAVISDGGDGHAFAMIDTDNREVVFSRLPLTRTAVKSSTVGIVVDTSNITERDSLFWQQFAIEMAERDARTIIFAGNHWTGDIGRSEFDNFQVYYYLLSGQEQTASVPENWHLIPADRPVVDLFGHRFLMQYSLGVDLAEMSEYAGLQHVKNMFKQYHQVDYVVCGLNSGALFEEGENVTIVNPGRGRNGRSFVTVCLPQNEVTFSRVRIAQQNHA